MNIGPTNIAAGAAGAPLAQTKGSTVERAEQQLAVERRQFHQEQRAAAAADVGEPDGDDHEAADRDADGRCPCEQPPEAKKNPSLRGSRQSKDPSQQRGNLLDLTG
jgi:hypothetical protein